MSSPFWAGLGGAAQGFGQSLSAVMAMRLAESQRAEENRYRSALLAIQQSQEDRAKREEQDRPLRERQQLLSHFGIMAPEPVLRGLQMQAPSLAGVGDVSQPGGALGALQAAGTQAAGSAQRERDFATHIGTAETELARHPGYNPATGQVDLPTPQTTPEGATVFPTFSPTAIPSAYINMQGRRATRTSSELDQDLVRTEASIRLRRSGLSRTAQQFGVAGAIGENDRRLLSEIADLNATHDALMKEKLGPRAVKAQPSAAAGGTNAPQPGESRRDFYIRMKAAGVGPQDAQRAWLQSQSGATPAGP